MKILLHDRQTIDRVGTHPRTQKIIPWIWAGWGMENPWCDPTTGKLREPFVMGSLEAIKRHQKELEPWELLPARHATEDYGCGRTNLVFTKKAGLLGRSALFCYDSIERDTSPSAAVLRLDLIRLALKQESAKSPGGRGWFGEVNTPIMVIPNLYFFARATADLSYLDQPDKKVLTDLAQWLGGPSELLIPAWSCLQLGVDALPDDLPAKLRHQAAWYGSLAPPWRPRAISGHSGPPGRDCAFACCKRAAFPPKLPRRPPQRLRTESRLRRTGGNCTSTPVPIPCNCLL